MTERAPYPDDQRIEIGYWSVLIAPLGPFALWLSGVTDYIPMMNGLMAWFMILAAMLMALDFQIRKEELSVFYAPSRKPVSQTLAAAAWRWLAWSFFLLAAVKFYANVPEYATDWYFMWKVFLRRWILPAWLILGLPFTYWTLRRRSGLRWDRKDPAVYLLLVARGLPWGRWPAIFRNCFGRRARRVVWAGLLVKMFFIPIMFKFFIDNGYHLVMDLEDLTLQLSGDPEFVRGWATTAEIVFNVLIHWMFFIDVCLATFGYFITTRWLDAGVRSVDFSPLGLLSCLICYMPFNRFLSMHMGLPTAYLGVIESVPLRLAAMAGVLACTWFYLWATLAFGLRFSNITHRGLFTQGPYAYCRHPAYIGKNLTWWIESIPNLGDYRAVLCLLGWNAIYYLRSVTEERHLSLDPRYKTYMRKVKNRFFPHISFKNK